MMIRQQMVCVICVYGPQTGRTEAEKEAFREDVERLADLSDGQTMLCIAGDFNAHIGVVEPGDGESVGRFGWGTRDTRSVAFLSTLVQILVAPHSRLISNYKPLRPQLPFVSCQLAIALSSLLYCFPYHVILTWLVVFDVELYQMLSENPNRLHLPVTHHPSRGITLLSQVLKLMERVLDARIRRRVEADFGEEQQGFRKGRGTADGMYVLRQMVEKRLEIQSSMALGFVDLEKAFDTVHREMVMATHRVDGSTRSASEDGWEDVREDNSKSGGGRRSFGGVWGQDWTEAGQRAGLAVVYSSTGPHQQEDGGEGCHEEIPLDADDVALVANGKHVQETLEEWNRLFTRRGPKINLEKTEVLHIGQQREELDIELEGKKLTQGDSFVYLWGVVCGDGKTEREVRQRVQAGANAWRAVEGVNVDRRISKRKGKIMSTCVTPACQYGTETLALT